MNRVAFVTGGAGGIGQAICRSLAAAGDRVAVADRDFAGAQAVAANMGGVPIHLDVLDKESVLASGRLAEAELGPVDILINCAGWDQKRAFLDSDEDFTEVMIGINLIGPIRVTKLFVGGMAERGWGRIVNITSDTARVGERNGTVYSSAKGGLTSLTKSLAREFARAGVTVNAVSPAGTDTPLMREVLAGKLEKSLETIKRVVPIGRIGLPEEIAAAVAFLASDDAAYITGQSLSVNGGVAMG